MIHLTDTVYVEALWFLPGPGLDVMGIVYREGPDQPWESRYRFRYYSAESLDPFDGKDRKSTYSAKARDGADASLKALCGALDFVFDVLADATGEPVAKVLIRGGADDFHRELVKQPWAHVRTEVLPKTSDRPS